MTDDLHTRLPFDGVTRSHVVAGCNVDELTFGKDGDWVHVFCRLCGWTRMARTLSEAKAGAREHRRSRH